MVASFDTGEAEAINKAQMNFFNPNVPQDLAFIHAHFAKIASAIEKLEAQNMSEMNWTMFRELSARISERKWQMSLTKTRDLMQFRYF